MDWSYQSLHASIIVEEFLSHLEKVLRIRKSVPGFVVSLKLRHVAERIVYELPELEFEAYEDVQKPKFTSKVLVTFMVFLFLIFNFSLAF